MKLNTTDKWFRYISNPAINEDKREIDLRLYKVIIGVAVDLNYSGSDSQIENQIRGIREVTTVSHLSDRQKDIGTRRVYREYEIKFELFGGISRIQYRDRILVPAIMKEVHGVKVVMRSKVKQVEYGLRESFWAGTAYGTANKAESPQMPHTPSLTIDAILQDWQHGAVQAYDTPMDTRDMAYHVMVPVDELWELCGRYYRGSKQEFDGRYQDFIKNGSRQPVFVAVGRNGRVKLTGNEDDVWFAKKSGLKELPVFFSYQRQV